MTSLRSLEVQNWKGWEDVEPLAALPLLTRLTCDQGARLMADMLQPGCLQSLEVASLLMEIARFCFSSFKGSFLSNCDFSWMV